MQSLGLPAPSYDVITPLRLRRAGGAVASEAMLVMGEEAQGGVRGERALGLLGACAKRFGSITCDRRMSPSLRSVFTLPASPVSRGGKRVCRRKKVEGVPFSGEKRIGKRSREPVGKAGWKLCC